MTAPYASEHEGGILWNDPDLGIEWPVGSKDAVVSERDSMLPPLRDLATPGDGGADR
jgi:dTDP-4-dehydrorhamnose 3,5-epimerase